MPELALNPKFGLSPRSFLSVLLSSVIPEAGSPAGSRGTVGSSKLGFDCVVIGAGGTPGPLRVLPSRLLPLPLVLSEIDCAKRFSWDNVIGKLNRKRY